MSDIISNKYQIKMSNKIKYQIYFHYMLKLEKLKFLLLSKIIPLMDLDYPFFIFRMFLSCFCGGIT